MSPMEVFEWTGGIAGIIGTFIMSTNKAGSRGWRFFSFLLYLVSNVAFLTIGVRNNLNGLITMNVVYLLITLNGLKTNRP